MEKLMLLDNDITIGTPIGGNVDVDKYRPCISDAQISRLEELLGTELYFKMRDDFPNYLPDSIYEKLYAFIKPILIHQAACEYILIGAFTVGNSGIFKTNPQNATSVDKVEVDYLANQQRIKADMYTDRLERWLCRNQGQIPEYKCSSDNVVNPSRNSGSNPWYF